MIMDIPEYLRGTMAKNHRWMRVRLALSILGILAILRGIYDMKTVYDHWENNEPRQALISLGQTGKTPLFGLILLYVSRRMSLCPCYAIILFALTPIISGFSTICELLEQRWLFGLHKDDFLSSLFIAAGSLFYYLSCFIVGFFAYREIKQHIQLWYLDQNKISA